MSGMEVPEGWELKNIVEIIQPLENGERPKGGVKGITEGIPSLGGEHLNYNGKFDFGNLKFVPREFFKKQTRGVIRSNDILIVKDGATTGKASFIDETFPYDQACVNEHVFILRTNNLVIPKFLFYYIRSNFAQKKISKITRGTIGGINTKFVKDFPIVFPKDIESQKQIVAKLDHILEKLEEKKNQIISLIEQNKERIDFFEKNWFAYVIDKNIKQHPKSGEFQLIELEQVSKIIDSLHKTPKYSSEGIPMVRSTEIKTGDLNLKTALFVSKKIYDEFTKNHKPQRNDIVMSRVGTYFVTSFVNTDEIFCMGQNTLVIHPLIDPKFLYYNLNSKFTEQQIQEKLVGSSGQKTLSLKNIRALLIFVPPLSIQKQIVKNIQSSETKFQSQKQQFEKIKESYESRLKYIDHIQSSILDTAFSGKLAN